MSSNRQKDSSKLQLRVSQISIMRGKKKHHGFSLLFSFVLFLYLHHVCYNEELIIYVSSYLCLNFSVGGRGTNQYCICSPFFFWSKFTLKTYLVTSLSFVLFIMKLSTFDWQLVVGVKVEWIAVMKHFPTLMDQRFLSAYHSANTNCVVLPFRVLACPSGAI